MPIFCVIGQKNLHFGIKMLHAPTIRRKNLTIAGMLQTSTDSNSLTKTPFRLMNKPILALGVRLDWVSSNEKAVLGLANKLIRTLIIG